MIECRLKERTPKGSWKTTKKAVVKLPTELYEVLDEWGYKGIKRALNLNSDTIVGLSVLKGYSDKWGDEPHDDFDVIHIKFRIRLFKKMRGEGR